MEDRFLELETILEEEENYEPNPEEEPLLDDISSMEIKEQYLVRPECLDEVQNAIEECWELPHEESEDRYSAENELFDIQNAIYLQKL